MSWVRFEPTIPEFERAKSVHALDRAATVIGITIIHAYIYSPNNLSAKVSVLVFQAATSPVSVTINIPHLVSHRLFCQKGVDYPY
jgi:hypothetical protein